MSFVDDRLVERDFHESTALPTPEATSLVLISLGISVENLDKNEGDEFKTPSSDGITGEELATLRQGLTIKYNDPQISTEKE